MSDIFQALKRIAPKLNELPEDPNARVSFEMMSGGLVWSDELPAWDQMEPGESHCLRAIWRFRSSLILGCPAEKYRPYWEEAQQLFPNWPGFHLQRRDSQWRQFLTEASEKSSQEWEEADRKYRESRQPEQEPQRLPAT
jgi:hypothetical protein